MHGVGAIAVAFVLLVASPALARTIVIDRKHARGDFAITVAGGSVDNPLHLL